MHPRPLLITLSSAHSGGRELDDLYRHGERGRRNKEGCHDRCYFHHVLRREYCGATAYQELDEGEALSGTVGGIDYLLLHYHRRCKGYVVLWRDNQRQETYPMDEEEKDKLAFKD